MPPVETTRRPDALRPGAALSGRRYGSLLALILALFAMLATVRAVTVPQGGRGFYDENFNLEVVSGLLRGKSEPENFWYSPITWAPQLAVLWAVDRAAKSWDVDALAVFEADRPWRLNHFALVLCRLVNLLYALGAAALLARIARRVGGERVALWSAFVFITSPWAIHGAVEFKPDPLLLLTTLFTVDALLLLLRDERWRAFVRLGLAAGLTVTTKLNGALVAPTVAFSLWARGLSWRAFGRAAAAGALGLLVYLATQPWLARTIDAFLRVRVFYNQPAHRETLTFGPMVVDSWADLFGSTFLGPLFATLAVAGWVALTILSVRRWREGVAVRGWAVVLSYPLVFSVGMAALTAYPKANARLPMLPFLAMAAGWTIVSGIDRVVGLSRRLAAGAAWRRSLVAVAAGIVMVAFVAHGLKRQGDYLYSVTVRSTEEQLLRIAGEQVEPLALVAQVDPSGAPTLPAVHRAKGTRDATTAPVVRLRESPSEGEAGRQLELFDAEIHAPNRLDATARTALERRLLASWDLRIWRVEPRLFALRGEPWILVVRQWDPDGPPICQPLSFGESELPRPSVDVAELAVTITVSLGPGHNAPVPRLRLEGREVDLLWARRREPANSRGQLWTSRRLFWPPEAALTVESAGAVGDPASALCLQIWQRGGRSSR